MRNAVFYGVLVSFFFAFTIVFNRSMNLIVGNWMWSAALRYLFMFPMLLTLVIAGLAGIAFIAAGMALNSLLNFASQNMCFSTS